MSGLAGFIVRAVLSGLLVAAIAMVARRSPTLGGLIASLPLVSLLGAIWLWHDSADRAAVASYIGSTLWYILPSLPMFVIMPAMLRHQFGFWVTLLTGALITMALYLLVNRLLAAGGISP